MSVANSSKPKYDFRKIEIQRHPMQSSALSNTLKIFSKYSIVSVVAFILDATTTYLVLQTYENKAFALLLGCSVGLIVGYFGLEHYCFRPNAGKNSAVRFFKYLSLVCFIYVMRYALFLVWFAFFQKDAFLDALGILLAYGICFFVSWVISCMIFNKNHN